MGIDLLQNRSEPIPIGTYSRKYKFAATPELIHPIWRKTHFNIRWIYISLTANLLFWITFYAARHIPITKVLFTLNISLF